MYYVYVLVSKKDDNIYIGITNNLNRRLREHNTGRTQSTKSRVPFEIVYYEEVKERENARNREKFLKSGCGRELIKNILNK
ncbi:MAG: GIY-YIG nuclease family protein [Candidatus Omnitrophica bacterium]|nr:GIY-YIG nuclease family protein [Candidatus Omnitrophota bacterium]